MKFQKKLAKTKQQIPTASLPDIVFMLLLFFMVTTTLREHDVKVQYRLPDARAIEKIENKRVVSYVWVGRDSRIQIDDNIVNVDQIQKIMYTKRIDLPTIIVSLRIDKTSKMGLVTDIQQELRKAYCLRINYSSIKKM